MLIANASARIVGVVTLITMARGSCRGALDQDVGDHRDLGIDLILAKPWGAIFGASHCFGFGPSFDFVRVLGIAALVRIIDFASYPVGDSATLLPSSFLRRAVDARPSNCVLFH